MGALVLALTGCVTAPPTPTADPSASRSRQPTAAPPSQALPGALRLTIPAEPAGLTPAVHDPAAELLGDFLYESLYRLDARYVPVPEVAADEPAVSEDGLSWTVPIRTDVAFHDGTSMTAADVAAAFALALAPRCPYRDETCSAATGGISRVAAAEDGSSVVFTLNAPAADFGATVLAGVPILPAVALEASLGRFLEAAAAVPPTDATTLAARIAAATNEEACLEAGPPPTCDPAGYGPEIETLLRAGGVALPERSRFTTDTGEFDEASYAAALIGRLDLFAAVLATEGAERTAAALPLLDLNSAPVGSGRYQLERFVPGERVELRSFADHRDTSERAPFVVAQVVADPAVAATALKTGELEWLPAVPADEVSALEDVPGHVVAARAAGSYRALVFNVRSPRPYADPAARAAFLRCIDRAALVDAATGGRGLLATSLTWPDSWAARVAPFEDPGRDATGARALLADAGWRRGSDGVMARDGVRLTSELLVRPGRSDLLSFATGASQQLAECGIELRVREAALSSDDLIRQLEWPNEFDTVLVTTELASDPHGDFSLFHSRHITSETNPGDRNIGGFSDPEADALIDAAAVTASRPTRAEEYQRLAARLSELVPAVPIWYETSWSAVSTAVRDREGEPVDPRASRYAWNAASWRVGGR